LKVYLDSADVASWALPRGCPPVCGITTNPTLLLRAGLPVTLGSAQYLLQAAADHGMAELMLQLPSNDAVQARQWIVPLQDSAAARDVRLTIKLPCHPDWLPCVAVLQGLRQPFLLTGLSNAVQLLWAQSLQADFVAPYLGRLAADGRDVWTLVQACVAVQSGGPALLAASIRSSDVLARLLACGAAAVTVPPASLVGWADDALTQAAMAQFAQDAAASLALKPAGSQPK